MGEQLEDRLDDLLARSSLGDRGAFRELYAATSAKLYGVAMRILDNRGEAEEVLQEAFVKIWHSAARFDASRGSAAGWLVTIVRNQAIDSLRARKPVARDIDTMFDLADAGPTPEAEALASDDRRRIERCLGELADERSIAVKAAYLDGHTYADIARRFDVPLNTMRTWLRRALISLRECLAR